MNRARFIKACAALLITEGVLAACGDSTSNTGQATTTASQPTNAIQPTTNATAPTTTIPIVTTAPPTTAAATTTNVAPSTATAAPANTPTPKPAFTLEQAVGQRMFAVLPGGAMTPTIEQFLLKVRPGGLVMFGSNIQSLAQIKQFNADLQAFAARNAMPPFIITLDEEGGIVSRMPPEAADRIAPSQMAQAAAGLQAVKDCARQTAIRLASLGFNLNLAPDADVNSNYQNPVIGTRSYGSDPQAVAQCVQAALGQYKALNVGACVKHFPGHGDTDVDSHTGLPIVNKSRADLDKLELVPFRAAIAAGTPALMSAHILFPQVEPNGLPATLSPYFLKQVLRDELKYQGLIFTDSLTMGAITQKYGLAEAARLAIRAGADVIIANGDLNDQSAIFDTLVAAAKRNEFDRDAPLSRILNFKNQYVKTAPAQPEDAGKIAAAAQGAITLLRSEPKSWPLTNQKPLLINFALTNATQVEGQAAPSLLGSLWRERFGTTALEVSVRPTAAETSRVLSAANSAATLVLVTRDALDSTPQTNLVQQLLALGKPVVIVAARDPYDLLAFPQASTYLATYSDVAASLRALVKVMDGSAPPTGKLPAALPGLYPIGTGN